MNKQTEDTNQRQWLQVPLRQHQPQPEPRDEQHAQAASGAAHVARTQISHIYETNPPHQQKDSEAVTDTDKLPQAYDRQHQDASQYDWHQYHAAWQNYYQQYYHRYYSQQLDKRQKEIQGERATEAAVRPEQEKTQASESDTPPSPAQKIKAEILSTVTKQAKKFRSSSHFMPVATALAVGIVFFFLQFNKVIAAQVSAYVSPSQTISDNVIVDPNASPTVGNGSRLIIPKINVDVPIVYGLTSLDNASTQKALEKGVAHYPIPGANSLPGQTGNNVILGHSSNDVFAPGAYKFAFVLLERLQPGDLFYVHYKGKRYVYKVTEKEVIKPDEVSKLVRAGNTPLATLVTCTPIGTDDKRLLVYAEQISPDPSTAEKISAGEGNNERVNLPGNEPSLFERLFNF